MKKFLSILALCAMPLIVTSCAKSPTEPEDETTANQEQVKDSCAKVVPGTVIEIREIDDDDDCTCKLVREGDDDDDDEKYESDDDRFGHKHHHDNGHHRGHYKNKHKHKKHDKYYQKSVEKRTWIVVIVPQCGDNYRYTVICARNGQVVEIKSVKPSCNDTLRPNDSCITYKAAETTVTTQKKGAEVKEWEAEQNPTTKQWKYYFTVKVNDKTYLVAVDAQTGVITEDKEI